MAIVIVGLLLVQTVIGTGFIHIVMNLDAATEIAVGSICFGAVAASGLIFVFTFLELEALLPRSRR